MWRHVFLLLRRQPGKSALTSSGFLLATCALLLLSATTQTTIVRADRFITQNWRPTYDLVVLPPQATIAAGQPVPVDVLQGYGGGISSQQYEQIKRIPGIEVAAPIAYLGYVTLPVAQIAFPDRDFPSGYYQLGWKLTAFNGYKHIVEYQDNQTFYISACSDRYDFLDAAPSSPPQCFPQLPRAILTFPFPSETGVFLLAAIDPAAENQLVHLDRTITHGRMLTTQDVVHTDQRITGELFNTKHQLKSIQAVPLLIRQSLPSQITLETTFTQFTKATVASGPQRTIFHGAVPLGQYNPQQFTNVQWEWNGHAWQQRHATGFLNELNYSLGIFNSSAPSNLTYHSTTGPDGHPAYSLVPTGVAGAEVAFRKPTPIQHLKHTPEQVFYTYEAIGQFSDAGIAAQLSNPLNWLPESTYTVPPTVLRYDAHGKPVAPTTLLPTTKGSGYIMQPPLALTTLAAAQQLIGGNIISAIRVRVAGVNRANQESWKRIQQIAAVIRDQTHLPLQVTLGSSPQPTLVYVPGVNAGQFGAKQDIEPTGWVEERWIVVGASILYLTHLGATQMLLLATVLGVCLAYLLVAFQTLATTQRRELAILSALGWRPWHSVRLFLLQAVVLALIGGGLGLGLALLLDVVLEITPVWPLVLVALPVVLVLAVLSSLYPLWQLWHLQPAEILRTGPVPTSSKMSSMSFLSRSFVISLWGLVLRNLVRAQFRTLLTIVSLFGSAVLLLLTVSGIFALRQTLTGTLLGDFVLLQTAIPQLAGCLFAMFLTFLSVTDLLALQIQQRRREICLLQAVGWQTAIVHRLFVREGLVLTLIGTLPGVVLAQWLLHLQQIALSTLSALLITLGTLLLLLLVAALAIILALRVVNRMQLIDVLRAE